MKVIIIILTQILLFSCQSSTQTSSQNIVAVFAHPDDETWVSGTLAKLADQGLNVIPIYLTSGDKGRDISGSKLSGRQLAIKREMEATDASISLGLSAPIFLRFPDSKTYGHQIDVTRRLAKIVDDKNPIAIFTFEPQGITGNKDHKLVSKVVTTHFKNRVILFCISQRRVARFYHHAKNHGVDYTVKHPIIDAEISFTTNVDKFRQHRISAMAHHKTQFPPQLIAAFSDFVSESKLEEFLLLSNDKKLADFRTKYLSD